ncbi:MAG: GHKL domain-containing protein [Chitinophagaceae bacterium]|nr:MAG: GHKL domain-containing protein [Chitinophagaceae bacterium]
MALPLKIKIRWGYLIAFLMLVISYFLVFKIVGQLSSEAKSVSDSYEIVNKLETVKAEITDCETGVRGYILTQDVRFLQPYNSGSKNVRGLVKDLTGLTTSKHYNEELQQLTAILERRLGMLAGSITRFQQAGNKVTDQMRANRETNRSMMDSIRTQVKRLQTEELKIMNARRGELESSFTSTEIIAITSLVITLVAVIYSLLVYTRENRAKELADKKTQVYRHELESRVTELDKVNTELQELKSIEKFASTGRIARTIAHEVRNPLTNISLAAEQIRDGVQKNPEAELLLDMITRNATRINQLVSDLLNSTRFAQLDITPSDINEVLDDALEQAHDRIELNSVKVEKKYDEHIGPVLIDHEKIKLAFLNIIVNAIEAMENGKAELHVSSRLIGDKCLVEIRDNGLGMDEEAQQRLFEPYFTSKQKGNGLGLTNTQNIIFNHKGTVRVKSKPGAGTIFQIILNKEGIGE